MQALLQNNLLDLLTLFPTSMTHLRSFYMYHHITYHYDTLHASKIKYRGNLNFNSWIQNLVYQILHHGQQTKIFT